MRILKTMVAKTENKSPKPWFRKYWEWMNDPKVQMMSETDQRRLDMLLCIRCSGQSSPSDDEIMFALRIGSDEWAKSKHLFVERGFIDDKNRLRNWDKRQYESDTSTGRVKEYRNKKRAAKQDETFHNRFSNADVTPPETEYRVQSTETDSSGRVILPEEKDCVSYETLARSDAGASSAPLSDEAETGSDQPQKSEPMPTAMKGELPEHYHQRYMAWARCEIVRLKDAKSEEWTLAYPAVDIDRECARAAVWLDANPGKRKKRIAAFLTGWLSRTQERSGNSSRGSPGRYPGTSRLSGKEQRTVDAVLAFKENFADD